jgi:hypothetical protein
MRASPDRTNRSAYVGSGLDCWMPLPSAAVAVRIAVTARESWETVRCSGTRAVRAVKPVQVACAPSVRWLPPCVTRLGAARLRWMLLGAVPQDHQGGALRCGFS